MLWLFLWRFLLSWSSWLSRFIYWFLSLWSHTVGTEGVTCFVKGFWFISAFVFSVGDIRSPHFRVNSSHCVPLFLFLLLLEVRLSLQEILISDRGVIQVILAFSAHNWNLWFSSAFVSRTFSALSTASPRFLRREFLSVFLMNWTLSFLWLVKSKFLFQPLFKVSLKLGQLMAVSV